MPNYLYQALGSDGQRVSGEIAADRVSDAIAELEARGLEVESIRAVVPVPDLVSERKYFYQRIEAALENREGLVQALTAMAEEMPQKSGARDVRQLINELQSGMTATQFVERESTASWLPLVVRGHASPSTAERYGQLMDDATRESENRRSLRSLLAYPLTLLAFGGVVFVFLALLVVPTFDKMFREFGLTLPAPTALLIWISQQITNHLPRTMAVVVVAAFIFIALVRLWMHFALSTRLLGLFTSGNSVSVTAMARFAGSLAELLSIAAPLPDALQIAGRACKHRHFRVMADRLAADLQVPHAAADESTVAHNFPPLVRYAVSAGRAGKPSVPLLRELSRMYSDRARARISWSTSILGPISLIAVGVVVGFVVIALFLPLVSLVTSLS